MMLALLLACSEPEPAPRLSVEAPLPSARSPKANYDALVNPEKPPRPTEPAMVRTAADLIAQDLQWAEVHGVLAPIVHTRPPKPQWQVRIELSDGTRLSPVVVGDVSVWSPLEGRPTRVVALISLCGAWVPQQIGSGQFLVDQEAPELLEEQLVVTTDETARETAVQAVEAHCARRREQIQALLDGMSTPRPTAR